MKIIFKIKELRNEMNWTLNKLSKKSGVSVTHINDIEKGKKQPTLLILVLIAKAFNKEITELYKIKW